MLTHSPDTMTQSSLLHAEALVLQADRPLLTDKEDAEEGTSAGLDGAAPGKKGAAIHATMSSRAAAVQPAPAGASGPTASAG